MTFRHKSLLLLVIALIALETPLSLAADRLVWPPAPDPARVEHVGSIECRELSPSGGFLQKITRWIGGRSDDEILSLPFDVLVTDRSFFMICQNVPALVEVNRSKNEFKLHKCKDQPMAHPISLCDGGNGLVFVTDPESGAVFKFDDGRLKPFITVGLDRPTGIAALPDIKRLYVVDTGDQSFKIFDYEGHLIRTIKNDSDGQPLFNYPSFATVTGDGRLLINDGLNYQIKSFDSDGNLIDAFGREGDGPGAFSRPKGIAVDSDAHVYVIDNMFDNLQVFDPSGQILLALGSAGSGDGQFWSPAGIDITSDTIYIADTYNHRVQILRYLGDQR